jgi:predicted AAA+ superfamily ATPase
MIDHIVSIYRRLLAHVPYDTHRYLFDRFSLTNRLSGLIGPRGTGKTTLILQFIKEYLSVDECIYVSMDLIYFTNHSLFDFVKELYELQGIRYFFLDEVHKYPAWNQELKNIYDSYPDIWIVFSDSSSIDLVYGMYDLSRRGVLFHLTGMSFREYLLFKGIASLPPLSLQELFKNRVDLETQVAAIPGIRGHFKDYLDHGYYPFFMEDVETYNQKLFRIIEKTIFEDISQFYKLKTENLYYFKRILSYIATIPPGALNRNSIARNIGLDYKTIQYYLSILEETGLVTLLSREKSHSAILKSTEKIYLENPNLYSAIAEETGYSANTGSIRELFIITMLKNSGHSVFYSPVGDLVCDGTYLEIGGKHKTQNQITNAPGPTYLVKDDILYGSKKEIPLLLFGFLY